MSELNELKMRLAALEGFVFDLRDALKKFGFAQGRIDAARKQASLPHDLLPAEPSPKGNPVATNAARELSDELVAAFESVTGKKYVFDGAKDGQAVQRLVRLRFEDRAELLARWEQAVKMTNHPGTKSIAVFATRVNEYGNAAAAKKQPISAPPAGDPYGEDR